MKAIIFGAGASYDSKYHLLKEANYEILEKELYKLNNNEWVPPLANEIFANRPNFEKILDNYPGAKALSALARQINDIEIFLEKIQQKFRRHRNIDSFKNFINTIFFLQELFYTISEKFDNGYNSNYDILVQKAKNYSIEHNEPVIFITFNYDILLERSLERCLGYKIKNATDYISSNIKVFKPHGSCNWLIPFGHPVVNGLDCSQLLYNEPSLYSKLVSVDSSNMFVGEWNKRNISYGKEVRYSMPQIVMPLHSKIDFVFPTEHKNELNKHLNKIDSILIIGWRAAENHFLEFLNHQLNFENLKLTYVCGGDDTASKNFKKKFNIKTENETFFTKPYAIRPTDYPPDEPHAIRPSEYPLVELHGAGSFSAYNYAVSNDEFDDFFN